MRFVPALIPAFLLGYAIKKHYDKKHQTQILIDAETLNKWQKKNANNIKVLNASFPMPVNLEYRKSVFNKERIPKAQFFDLTEIKDQSSKFPFMYPDQKYFQEMMRSLDIIPSDIIVIYDDFSLVGACRAWWLLKMYGAESVYILNGGLAAWKENNFETDTEEIQVKEMSVGNIKRFDYRLNKYKKFKLNKNYIANLEQIKAASAYINSQDFNQDLQILDARDEQNFTGSVPEKFEGCKAGNIIGSQNLFWKQLLEENSKSFKSDEEIKEIFSQYGVTKNVDCFLSCRTGMMASVLFVGLEIIGFKRKALFNGSWLEYGTQIE